jgi:hypothetical protein
MVRESKGTPQTKKKKKTNSSYETENCVIALLVLRIRTVDIPQKPPKKKKNKK